MNLSVLNAYAAAMRLPKRVAFTVFGLDVYWYGVFLAAGILAAIILAQIEIRRRKLDEDTAIDVCLIGIPLGIVFSRLFYVFAYFSYFKSDLLSILYLWDGGMSQYGALFGAFLGLVLYSLKKKVSILRLTDLIAPGLALAQGLARWGDFFNQQAYGPEVTAGALQWFPFAVKIEASGTIHYAAFFYEFLWCTAVFAVLWFYVRRRSARDGMMTLWYLVLFFAGHAAILLLRGDTAPVLGRLSVAEVICFAIFLAALAALILVRRKTTAAKRPAVCAPDAAEAADETTEAAPDTAGTAADAAVPEPPAEGGETGRPEPRE